MKWRESAPFNGRGLGHLAAFRGEVPGAADTTLLVGVSCSGFSDRGAAVDLALTPDELLAAWERERP